jgi:type I restriction enzyme R subunit
MRPINSMIEFKQIVGRGTRLYDGKDYFTIYDFVDAHKHFRDPTWDGEPIDPVEPTPKDKKPCRVCQQQPCVCEKEAAETCEKCNKDPCCCDAGTKIVTVTLSNNNVLEFDSMIKTSFWSPTGTPISATDFILQLYSDLPDFFSSEEELRRLWSLPDTRKKLLTELSDKGYSYEQLSDLRNLVNGADSDLFDVLNYIAYHKDLVPRFERAKIAKMRLSNYNPNQQDFLNFVLEQYVEEGVDELYVEKLSSLLTLKYSTIADAKNQLGDIKSIRQSFIDFQQTLYNPMLKPAENAEFTLNPF